MKNSIIVTSFHFFMLTISFHAVSSQGFSSDTIKIISNQETASTVYAYNDFARLNEDDTISINVLSNDIGLDEGVRSLKVTTEPEHGSTKVNEDNTIQYIPNRSYFGSDSLIYEVCNNSNSCSTAKTRIIIEDVNFSPIAVNDTITYVHNSNITVPILNNDTIKGDVPNLVSIISNIHNGNSYVDENNQIIPTFNRSFVGKDSLEYSLCDSDGDCAYAIVIFLVKHEEGTEFYIPNGFSPNGDGINDNFYIPDFSTYTNINARIITETGQIVFQKNQYQNNWNGISNTGRMKGQPLPSGTYYYIFSIEGVSEVLTGYVYLSR